MIVAGSGVGYPAQMRERGAQTIHWDNYLSSRVGTPSAPADPDVLKARAERLYDFAVLTTGCATPWIAINELFGASVPTPWTPTTTRYRQNVLEWMRLLAARGAKPILLVSSDPFTGGEAAQWWRDVAAVGDIVIEKYFNAPAVHRAGPVLGSRRMRTSMRQVATKLFAINIPPSKLGFMLAFQTRPGSGGREGLKPASAWFEVAKLQALAAKQVARELSIAHVWSWGWGVFNEAGSDPDKQGAACVWLWARNPSLCNAPRHVAEFDADLREGQIDLAGGVRCALGDKAITTNQIGELTRLTRDPEVALSALYGRVVESGEAPVGPHDILAAERTVIARRFGGSTSAYRGGPRRGHAPRAAVARGILGDELRRRSIQARLTVPVALDGGAGRAAADLRHRPGPRGPGRACPVVAAGRPRRRARAGRAGAGLLRSARAGGDGSGPSRACSPCARSPTRRRWPRSRSSRRARRSGVRYGQPRRPTATTAGRR